MSLKPEHQRLLKSVINAPYHSRTFKIPVEDGKKQVRVSADYYMNGSDVVRFHSSLWSVQKRFSSFREHGLVEYTCEPEEELFRFGIDWILSRALGTPLPTPVVPLSFHWETFGESCHYLWTKSAWDHVGELQRARAKARQVAIDLLRS